MNRKAFSTDRIAVLTAVILAWGLAGPGTSAPAPARDLSPGQAPVAAGSGQEALVPAATTSVTESGTVSIVTNGWVDVRTILQSLAANNGLGLQVAPDVQGKVNVHLERISLDDALVALLEPANLGYELDDGVLIVYKRGLVTRWFTFDYPVTERVGRGELEISVSNDGSGSGGSSGSEGQNKSHVTSMATMTVWPQVMQSLQTMVFEGVSGFDGGQSSGEDQLSINLADGEGRSLLVNPMASLVQVTAEWDRVQKVAGFLERIKESLQRQVAIQVQILEVYLDEDTQTGINWDSLAKGDVNGSLRTFNSANNIADNYFQFVVDSSSFSGVLQAISTSGDIKTISSPRVTTLNNQKAVVRVVTEEVYYISEVEPALVSNGVATEPITNYRPRTVSVGVVLDVTPQVGQDRVITLNVHPTISDIVGIAESPNADTAPILSIRELDTVGKVTEGKTLVIAGLISERKNISRSGIPVLKDLPVLGYFFGKTRSQKVNIELVMLITPVILEGGESDALVASVKEKIGE